MKSISVFEMIKIGIGPSSSHTMGPWEAASYFIKKLRDESSFSQVKKIQIDLYGSLAMTGKGHGTDVAIMMGLLGADFRTIDTNTIPQKVEEIKASKTLYLDNELKIDFDYDTCIQFFKKKSLDFHANGMEFIAFLDNEDEIKKQYFSVGGGFVATEEVNTIELNQIKTPYPCHNAKAIAENCERMDLSVSDLIYLNEQAWQNREGVDAQATLIWSEIQQCVYRGVNKSGILPGGLEVKRRATELNKKLLNNQSYGNFKEWLSLVKQSDAKFSTINKWISCFALAVNEENASFGRVITAPTNGAAGVIPAVLMYAFCFEKITEEQVIRFILTAGEIGTLFKKNATISAAMGGCQAEIGVSSAMAAAGLTEALGGTPAQVLMSAEIAMEHHLGLTCDPIGGLVQIPCIERNSMGAMKAITASNIALESDPKAAKVSLDDVIKSMWETAQDMNLKYKETSAGGLATNISVGIAEC